jgi:hypothetical protein
MIGSPGNTIHRIPPEVADVEDDHAVPGLSGRWFGVLAVVSAIAWIAFIVLLALFVTTSTT